MCTVEYEGFRFTVLSVNDNTVQRVKIEKTQEAAFASPSAFFMLRSIVSLGMLLAFAFAMTSRSLLLFAGSELPPSALTDNRNRTATNVKNAFTKGKGNVGTPGCVSFMFDNTFQMQP